MSVFHRYSTDASAFFVLTADSGAAGATYATAGKKIPGVQTITISGNASQEELGGDDLVLGVENSDEALDVTIEHAQESFDMLAAIKGSTYIQDGDDEHYWDTPPDGTVYVALHSRCKKIGVAGDHFLRIFKMNMASFERSTEHKAFGKNSVKGKAIYTNATWSECGDKVARFHAHRRSVAQPLALNLDLVAPTLTSVPLDAATGVAVTANVVYTASKPLDANTVNDKNFFIVVNSTGAKHAADVSLSTDGLTVTVNPTANFSASTAYQAYATENVRDKAGNRLAALQKAKFTTA